MRFGAAPHAIVASSQYQQQQKQHIVDVCGRQGNLLLIFTEHAVNGWEITIATANTDSSSGSGRHHVASVVCACNCCLVYVALRNVLPIMYVELKLRIHHPVESCSPPDWCRVFDRLFLSATSWYASRKPADRQQLTYYLPNNFMGARAYTHTRVHKNRRKSRNELVLWLLPQWPGCCSYIILGATYSCHNHTSTA